MGLESWAVKLKLRLQTVFLRLTKAGGNAAGSSFDGGTRHSKSISKANIETDDTSFLVEIGTKCLFC